MTFGVTSETKPIEPTYRDLVSAVEHNDVVGVCKLLCLNQGNRLLHLAVRRNHLKVLKMLIDHQVPVDDKLLDYIFDPANSGYTKERLAYILGQNKRDFKLLRVVFVKLASCDYEAALELDILKLLLDHGLPMNEFLIGKDIGDYTPLHLSIMNDRIDFVSLLLDRGADIHKRTANGLTSLNLAVIFGSVAVTEWLLKNGANVNEKNVSGESPLHQACKCSRPDQVRILLEYGADANALNNAGCVPLSKTYSIEKKKILVKHFARMEFECKFINDKNLKYLQKHEELAKTFDECLEELKGISEHVVFQGVTLYDILRGREHREKLVLLTKRKDFVAKFKTCWDRESYEHYASDLDDNFEEAVRRRNLLDCEEDKLYVVFKDYLPALAIRKISYYANKHLFFGSLKAPINIHV